ncbi:metallophosphoesterase [Streptosporangium canum]|uniref:metallophosphoesterase n=1 Tax=Streptosporangium canum TaxID=324952 RepID=UPI00379404F0
MAAVRSVEAIVATTDVHSALENPAPMLTYLHQARKRMLVADCGDFFEGSGYYTLGGGVVERRLLAGLYDVLAPGNHGWHHHLKPDLRPLTVCANVTDPAGNLLFRPLYEATVAGQRVTITAVIGEQAFSAIPAAERADARVLDPSDALRRLMGAHDADAWIVLSHSGYTRDLRLAETCPGVDVIFSAHCHSDRHHPTTAGTAQVVKGYEMGVGYALAAPGPAGWTASVHRFPPVDQVPAPLRSVTARIDRMRGQLAAPIGPLTRAFRDRPLNLSALLAAIAEELHARTGADAVVLNQTCLRAADLKGDLTRGDLLQIEPFGNQLTTAPMPRRFTADPAALLDMLTDRAGPIITAPAPLPPGLRQVLTTDYLASNFLHTDPLPGGPRLAEVIQRVLTGGFSDRLRSR